MLRQIQEKNDRARIDLLGEQWFQGRTGNVEREKFLRPEDSGYMGFKNKKTSLNFEVNSGKGSQNSEFIEIKPVSPASIE